MNRDRFKDLPFVNKASHLDVLLVGLGGIGSWLCYSLAKVGYYMVFYDGDTVESHNIGGQIYKNIDIGLNKAEAMLRHLHETNLHNFAYVNLDYTESELINAITISAVDNMKTRKLLFEKWVEYTKIAEEPCFFMDGRMQAENLQIYCVTPDKIEAYRETLFDDNEVKDQPCTAKSTTYCGMIIAGLMTSLLNNWTTNLVENDDVREVPFFTNFILPIMDYGTQG